LLQFVLFAMSVRGWIVWHRDERKVEEPTHAFV
jgi:hypothetical protein